MAYETLEAQRHIFYYHDRLHINKKDCLGHGAYGAVYKAKCDQLPCAAKVLHSTIIDPRDPGATHIMKRFQQECSFLESIRHPHIVLYLGTAYDPETRLPVLLMELLDESLTELLERSTQSLAFHIQVDICHDIALAVAHLHTKGIIHRDLSSNNVLITSGKRAKVTDFGMSKLTKAPFGVTTLTMCPGTLPYMPPEALREPLTYTKKLDCFSEGVIMIQVCTRRWPEPEPRTKLVPDSRSPTGTIEMPVIESERRKSHINMISHTHMLRSIAIECLNNKEEERPSSGELCQRLADIKLLREYEDSKQQHYDVVQAKDNKITELENNIREMERLLQDLRQINHSLSIRLTKLQEQLSHVDQKQKRKKSSSYFYAQEMRKVFQEKHSSKRWSVQPFVEVSHEPHPASVQKVTLTWRESQRSGEKFHIYRGSAVVDKDVAYFMNDSGNICAYNSKSKMWNELPKCPNQDSSLAVINNHVTAIGGCENYFTHTSTNKLLSLKHDSWQSEFPSMTTMRSNTTVMTTKEYVVVAGGSTGPFLSEKLSTVEVMNYQIQPPIWSAVASLPHPYSGASATICGDQLYILGGYDRGETKLVLTCSLTDLLQSSLDSDSSIWHRVTNAPYYNSTCTTINGELLVVGGCDQHDKVTDAIYIYNTTTKSWELISNMPTARQGCLVAVLPTNEVMVIGGKVHVYNRDKVEIADFT